MLILNSNLDTVLWTNPNPTANIETMVITLSSDDYEVLDVYYTQTTDTSEMRMATVLKSYATTLVHVYYSISMNKVRCFYRMIEAYEPKKLNLSIAYGDEENISNRVIPIKIVGRKLHT